MLTMLPDSERRNERLTLSDGSTIEIDAQMRTACTPVYFTACEDAVSRQMIDGPTEGDRTMEENMTFGEALESMKEGRKVARTGWNGRGQFAAMQVPDAHSKMAEPYCYLCNVQGKLIPWVPSQGDLFADDWQLA